MIQIHQDLRAGFGPARDQLQRPTCLAFAFSDAHAALRPPWTPLSPEYLFYYAKARETSAPATGARLSSIREALSQEGQPVEAAWPYKAALPNDHAAWKPPVDVVEVFRRKSEATAGSFSQVWDCINRGDTVVMGMTISRSFYLPGLDSLVDGTEAIEPARRHAVVAVGNGECGGARVILARNSWGDSWGSAGYAWISERYLAPRVLDIVLLKEAA